MSLNSLYNIRQNISARLLGSVLSPEHKTNVYIEEAFSLIKSLIVKNTDEEYAMDQQLIAKGVNIGLLPYSKYVANLYGEYYPTFDEPMKIEINGTSFNITKTMTPSQKYLVKNNVEDIIKKYPLQEILIKGIINPIHPDKSKDVENGTILYFNKNLVEYRENTLMSELQERIYLFIDKQHVEAYRYTDDLYPGVFWGYNFMGMVSILLNLRQNRIKTIEVHSYHMALYLESFAGIGVYVDILDDEQSYWLYRNIQNLKKFSGSQKSMDKLIRVLYDFHEFSLRGYDYNKNRKMDNFKSLSNYNTSPLAKSVKATSYTGITPTEFSTLIAEGDKEYQNPTKDILRSTYSESDHYKTKLLESTFQASNGSAIIDRGDYLIGLWTYYVANNLVNANAEIESKSSIRVPDILTVSEVNSLYLIMTSELICKEATKVTSVKKIHGLYLNSLLLDMGADSAFIDALRDAVIPMQAVDTLEDFKEVANASYSVIESFYVRANSTIDTTLRARRLAYLNRVFVSQLVTIDIGNNNLMLDWKLNHSVYSGETSPENKELLIISLVDSVLDLSEDVNRSQRFLLHGAANAILTRLMSYNVKMRDNGDTLTTISLSRSPLGIHEISYKEKIRACLTMNRQDLTVVSAGNISMPVGLMNNKLTVIKHKDTIRIGAMAHDNRIMVTENDNGIRCLAKRTSKVAFNLSGEKKAPVLTLLGPSAINVQAIDSAPTLFLKGMEVDTTYEIRDTPLYFFLIEYSSVTEAVEDLLIDVSNVRFTKESSLVDFIESKGVSLAAINNMQSSTKSLETSYGVQKERKYNVSTTSLAGTITIFAVIEKPWVDPGAVAYDFRGDEIPYVVNEPPMINKDTYNVSYTVQSHGHTITKVRPVTLMSDPRLHVEISVNAGISLYRKDGEMEVMFPVEFDPNDYNIQWEQLDIGNEAATVVMTGSTNVIMSFIGTDYLTKKFRVYLNKNTVNEQYVDQFFYHSPIEEVSVESASSSRTDVAEFTDHSSSKSLSASIIGNALPNNHPMPTSIYHLGSNYVGLDTVTIINSIPNEMVDGVTKTIVEKNTGIAWVTQDEFVGYYTEINGIIRDTELRIVFEGLYRGREYRIIVKVTESVPSYAELVSVSGSDISSVSNSTTVIQQTYRQYNMAEETVSVSGSDTSGVSSTTTVIQQSNVNIG